ncbi:hypothetical protein M422DRAFT_272767 [Sphaerobolus stellatus SS14]|uniref:Protein kinase domain-containing protein n=1 Tax=Sphaerobolus stellatus (strain SS14) TaxID=990650 RepID=A0A0C9UL26_SPHS4|nr:hypothetical protein M422DRAFT_272767 [Sphaerobolus stellatus SS14]
MLIIRAFRRKHPNSGSDGEWISHAMKAAKITADAAKMIPVAGPFIKGGANIFCHILEPLKQSKDNKEMFKELTQSITRVFHILQKAISGTPRAEPSDEFTKICSDFKSLMERLLKDHTLFVSESQSRPIRNYLRSEQIRGMISKYQKDINTLREDLVLYCTVSIHLQVQMFKIDGSPVSVSLLQGMDIDHIPEFEDFHELKLGDINLQAEIKQNNSILSVRRRMPLPFKEYHALTSANGMSHRTTVKVYEGKESKEQLKAELQIMEHLRHPNITQVLGFCKSQHLLAVIFYEDLRPVEGVGRHGTLDLTWNILEHLTTRYQMSRDIQDGVRHIQAKLPSFLNTEKNQYWGVDFNINIGYIEPGKAQLGIYFGNDNHVKSLNLAVKPDTGSDFFTASNYSSTDVIIDKSRLQALQTQLESRVARSLAETTSLLQSFHSVIPVFYECFSLDSDKVLLGGVYARYLPCPTCQQCSGPYHFTSLSEEMKLVAGFSSNDFNVNDWKLSTTSSEVWSSLKQSDKGIQLSFTEYHTTERMTLFQYCHVVNDRESDTLLWNSFLAEICNFKSGFDAILCPTSRCKLLDLSLGYAIEWYIELEVENTPGTWPQCPQGTTRLTMLLPFALAPYPSASPTVPDPSAALAPCACAAWPWLSPAPLVGLFWAASLAAR